MKWAIFTAGCVVALVTLGYLAVDERDAVWEGRNAHCPNCRAEIAYHSVVCRECNRSLDWRSTKEACRWCLDHKDVDHLLGLYREIVQGGPLPEALAAYGPYFEAIDVGNCTYCGGLGKVMDAGKEIVCPICRGDKRCIACGGTRSVVIGDEASHRRALEREDARRRALVRAEVADLPLNVEVLIDEDVAALRGHVDAERLTDAAGRNLLEAAQERLKIAFRELHEVHAQRAKDKGGS